MQTVTVRRTIEGSPEAVRDAMGDLEAFIRAAGFDEVTVADREISITNGVGIAEISLELAVVDDPDAALAYEQREGIFEAMRTRYVVDPDGDAVTVTATTEFAIDVSLVGGFLDATIVKRQRRRELTAQLDYLADVVEGR